MIKVGINGFGRIGKCIFLQLINNKNFQICALNAINLTALELEDYIKYDSTHHYTKDFIIKILSQNKIKINHHEIDLFSDRNGKNLKWKNSGCEYLFDATGSYLTTEKCKEHDINYVIMSAPPKDNSPTFIFGANHSTYSGENIISASSCTTNCLAPILKLLNDNYKIVNSNFTTIHATTASQYTIDIFNKSSRTNRSIFNNIIPSSTGASSSITTIMPELIGKINGTSVRVPVNNGSLLDLNIELENKKITLKDIEKLIKNHILFNIVYQINNKNLVSCDFITTTTPSILDVKASIDMGNGLFKLMLWYDNEWSYSAQMIRMVEYMFNCNNINQPIENIKNIENIEKTIKTSYYFENINMENKSVVLRVDFNVPCNNNSVTDDFRIRSAIPTIEYILSQNPTYLILVSHFGRPTKKNSKDSLEFIINILKKYLPDYDIYFLKDGIHQNTLDTLHNLNNLFNYYNNQSKKPVIYLLENIRFHPEETNYEINNNIINNTTYLYRQLGDIYISDAFGCVHRNHMSICDLKYSGKEYGYGKLIKKELDAINLLVNNKNSTNSKKILGIIGGNKIKDKMPLIDSLKLINNIKLFITGNIAKEFAKINNNNNNNINNINNINNMNNINNKKRTISMINNIDTDNIIIMNDGYGNISLDDKPVYIQNISELNNTENNHINCYDIGENSSEELFNLIDSADIIFWNGSLGVIEHEIYKLGSIRIVKYLEKKTDKKVIIGGGETASLFKSNLDHIYISTGGGALLEYLENKILYNKLLPGLDIFN